MVYPDLVKSTRNLEFPSKIKQGSTVENAGFACHGAFIWLEMNGHHAPPNIAKHSSQSLGLSLCVMYKDVNETCVPC